jgi:hypothetical protein
LILRFTRLRNISPSLARYLDLIGRCKTVLHLRSRLKHFDFTSRAFNMYFIFLHTHSLSISPASVKYFTPNYSDLSRLPASRDVSIPRPSHPSTLHQDQEHTSTQAPTPLLRVHPSSQLLMLPQQATVITHKTMPTRAMPQYQEAE